MPSLNVVDYIDECIQSVMNQTLKEIQIICVDAGSTDGTYEKLVKYSLQDNRIRIIKSDIKSYGKQINIGIKQAEGKYIGIVETDDFIDQHMYEELYDLSEKNDLEFIKGDYEDVFSNSDNTYTMMPIKMFNGKLSCYYNKIVSPDDMPILHVLGLNIWRGIYKREFLIENNIYLNETKGAAFQDTAFYHQLIMKSNRAMFVEKPYYKYRQDRAASSFRNPNTLIYTYDEYRYLIDKFIKDSNMKKSHWHYIYVKMFREYVTHIKNYIITHDYNMEIIRERFSIIEWFNRHITVALGDGIIQAYDFDNMVWYEYKMINESLNDFVRILQLKIKTSDEIIDRFWKVVENKSIIVFGTGAYGKKVSELLHMHGYEILAFCDNNKEINEFMGKKVFLPEQAAEKFSDAIYIVANKLYADEMKMQLEALGIDYSCIIRYDKGIK